MLKNINALKLCLVTDMRDQSFDQYQSLILKAIQGGVTSVQLRMKNANQEQMLSVGRALKSILDNHHIPLIINDDVHIAKALGAHLHLGKTDMTPDAAREIVGPDAWIGLSIESEAELAQANTLTSINYVAASAIFPSKTKLDCKQIWGLEGLKKIAVQSVHPMMAIGGITAENVKRVIENGACGVAVVGAIQGAIDPTANAANLIAIIDESLRSKARD